MSDTKHTPAPWSVGDTTMRKYAGGMTFRETRVHAGDPKVNGIGRGNTLAVVHMGGKGATNSTAEAVEANAHLIAAAPDLLAACFAALPEMEAYCDFNDLKDTFVPVVHQLRAAIAKATGGAA